MALYVGELAFAVLAALVFESFTAAVGFLVTAGCFWSVYIGTRHPPA